MKKCTKCKEIKSLDNFNKSIIEKDGLQYYCRDCQRKSKLKWYSENLDRSRQYSKKYRATNLEKTKEATKKWSDAHPEQRWMNVQKQKGILFQPIADGWFEKQLQLQDGVCAICDQECTKHPRLSIDHCHETGRVRGLLCNSCNVKLKHMAFDGEQLTKATEYLDNPSSDKNSSTGAGG